jgi:Fe2+ transport system protein B
MAAEINPVTGEKIFNFASGISLLLFYAFAMQCASTLAVTKRNQFLEVACRTIDLHVRLCLCSRVNHLSNAKIGNLNTLQLK